MLSLFYRIRRSNEAVLGRGGETTTRKGKYPTAKVFFEVARENNT